MKDKMDESKGSPYPYLRLILPEHDSARPHTGLKASKIAETWVKALGQTKGSKIHSLLTGYRNGKLIKNKDSVGDLSCVVRDVMNERQPGSGSKLTVGEINEWLDVLVDVVKDRFDMPTVKPVEKSKWRQQLEKTVRSGKKGDKYAALVEKLINKNLSVSDSFVCGVTHRCDFLTFSSICKSSFINTAGGAQIHCEDSSSRHQYWNQFERYFRVPQSPCCRYTQLGQQSQGAMHTVE